MWDCKLNALIVFMLFYTWETTLRQFAPLGRRLVVEMGCSRGPGHSKASLKTNYSTTAIKIIFLWLEDKSMHENTFWWDLSYPLLLSSVATISSSFKTNYFVGACCAFFRLKTWKNFFCLEINYLKARLVLLIIKKYFSEILENWNILKSFATLLKKPCDTLSL